MTQALTTHVRKSLAANKAPRSYEELLARVRTTLETGRVRARQALEEIESRMFWETGRWIHLFLRQEKRAAGGRKPPKGEAIGEKEGTPKGEAIGEKESPVSPALATELDVPGVGRAPYGEKVILKLADDLKFDRNYLYDALKVYRNNPIVRTYGQLPVKLHRVLLQVEDDARRKALAAQAQKEGWTRRELLAHIRTPKALADSRKPLSQNHTPSLRPRRGKLGHYRIVKRDGGLFLDLGFRDFRKLEGDFQDEDIVEGVSLNQLTKKPSAGKADLYTYRAKVLHFPDADTYWLFIDKGFGGFREDKIRLRGIDAPEIETPEGRSAKAFVEELLTLPEKERKPGGSSSPIASPLGGPSVSPIASPLGSPYRDVLITTTKTPDKWDRYLVDLYFEKDGREIYLNRLLLEKGHAVLYAD